MLNAINNTTIRKQFIEKLTELAEKDPKVILIIGDVGFSFLEPFIKRFPNQFLNAGICEQSMMGLAVGMANMGWKPYVYTMSNFILLRPLEQVRNDICYANANVKLFGVKGSAAYKFLGMSHNMYGTEEQDMVKHLPNLNTYFTETEETVTKAIEYEYQRKGPAYFSI